MTPLLEVDDIVKHHRTAAGTVQAVSGVSLSLQPGETLALVGESGCGKSTVGRAVVGLPPPDRGRVAFRGTELTALSARRLRPLRPKLQMILQDPRAALQPRRRVRDIVAEGLVNAGQPRETIATTVDATMAAVGLDPGQVGHRRPHEFSGGQCQRIAIARAIALAPEVLVCDEPVASLDVSVQAQVINLLADLQAERGLAMLFISHDLAVVRTISDRVAVMYMGRIVETGPVDQVYEHPQHPYTRALLDSSPVPDPQAPPLGPPLHGEVPSPLAPPSGCRFRTRCPLAEARCADETPALDEVDPGHAVACHVTASRHPTRPVSPPNRSTGA